MANQGQLGWTQKYSCCRLPSTAIISVPAFRRPLRRWHHPDSPASGLSAVQAMSCLRPRFQNRVVYVALLWFQFSVLGPNQSHHHSTSPKVWLPCLRTPPPAIIIVDMMADWAFRGPLRVRTSFWALPLCTACPSTRTICSSVGIVVPGGNQFVIGCHNSPVPWPLRRMMVSGHENCLRSLRIGFA